jgi:hypothetical protein
MEAIIATIIAALVPALLAWFFSGSTTTKVENTQGLEGMDRKSLSGTGDLTLKDLPNICLMGAVLLMLGLSGCAFGGSKVEVRYKLVEPGDVVECVEGRVKVRTPGSDDVGEIESAGNVQMPKSVYRQLRENWVKNNPGAAVPDTKPVVPVAPGEKPKPTQ